MNFQSKQSEVGMTNHSLIIANGSVSGNSLTMSSREIAQLVESRHSDVCTAIERLVSRGAISGYTAVPYTHPQNGQQYREYQVNKRDSYVVVAQLSPEFTARLVDRWQELENCSSIPQSLPEALRMAADLAEQKLKLEGQLAIAAPKAEFADRVGEAKGVLIGNFAKAIGIGQNKLFAWMRDSGVLISVGARRNVPKQEFMDRGYFTVRETPVMTNHGIQISFTAHITGKGQQWLTRKLKESGELPDLLAS